MSLKTSTSMSRPRTGRSSLFEDLKDKTQVPKWYTAAVFLSMVGSAIGLRKPYNFQALNLEGVNGPLRNLVGYITLVTPLTFLEISIGQFTSRGSVSIWEINSLFKGLGYTLVVMSIFMANNHNAWNAFVLYYILSTGFGVYPWANCDLIKNKCLCSPGNKNITAVHCTIKTNNINMTIPGGFEIQTEKDEYERFNWHFLGCSFLCWSITFAIVSQRLSIIDKAIAIFSVLYVFAMTAFIIHVVTLDTFAKGMGLYFDVNAPFDAGVVKWHGTLSLESFSLCSGVLLTYSRFNEFKSNTVVETIAMVLPDLALSIIFSVFMYIGFAEYSMTPDKLIEPESPLRFQVTLDIMALAMEHFTTDSVWVIMYFITQICAGFVGQVVIIQTIVYNLQEICKTRWKVKPYRIRIWVCVCGFIIGIKFAKNSGSDMVEIGRHHAALPFLIIAFFQVVCFVWVYGVGNFSEDMLLMLDGNRVSCILFKVYFKWCLVLVTPIVLLAAIILFFIKYFVCTQEEVDRKGFITVASILIWFPVYYIVVFFRAVIKRRNTDSFFTLFNRMNKPSVFWGPKLAENRTIQRYQRLFTLKRSHIFIGLGRIIQSSQTSSLEKGRISTISSRSHIPTWQDEMVESDQTSNLEDEFRTPVNSPQAGSPHSSRGASPVLSRRVTFY